MEKILLTKEMINNAFMEEMENGNPINDKGEYVKLEDAITDYTSSIQAKCFERYYKMGFEECLRRMTE